MQTISKLFEQPLDNRVFEKTLDPSISRNDHRFLNGIIHLYPCPFGLPSWNVT